MTRPESKTEPDAATAAWSATVDALSGAAPPPLPAVKGRVHKAKPRAVASQSAMVPHRLASGIRAGWKRERP